MNELIKLSSMSKYAGERFDLIQAGGGNTSVKVNSEQMYIKASGYLLSDVEINTGYVLVNNRKILELFNNNELLKISDKKQREKYAATILTESIDSKYSLRPSIETFLHSLLYKYTLHTHPVVVNAITFQVQWKEILVKLIADKKPLYISYQTPGIDLALEMYQELQNYIINNGQKPNVIFLQNHGLIISSDDYDEVRLVNEEILLAIESFLNVGINPYRITNSISHLINSITDMNCIAYLSEDKEIIKLIKDDNLTNNTPFCPDGFVFCGVKSLRLKDLFDTISIKNYIATYHETPKIIFYEDMLFIIASNIRKAKEIEDVYKFHLLSLSIGQHLGEVNTLSIDELNYLGNWDAEKYRQKL